MITMAKQIKPCPFLETSILTTDANYVDMVRIRMFKGEEERTCDHELLREFWLEGLPKKKKGLWMIEVVFDIDNDRILSVLIVDMDGGRENKITVKGMAEDVDGGG